MMPIHPGVDLVHRQFIMADSDLRFARAQYRETKDPILRKRLVDQMQVWEQELLRWRQAIDKHPDAMSLRAWHDADQSRVPIPD